MPSFEGFPKDCIPYLKKLAKNNNRKWFNDHKDDYENKVREPALAFIEAMGPEIHKISPYFKAVPKKVGGSLMRVYRDTRFSKDKTPYKTNIGIQFRHEAGKDVHAPGFYVHIEPGGCFIGAGIWHPESKVLRQIRDFIADNPSSWKKATRGAGFKRKWELRGDSLIRPPKGFDPEHELLADLKRKDFIAISENPEDIINSKNFIKTVGRSFKQTEALMSYLCMAVEQPF
ncbi:MAG: DUF2461 domain-containing protein [Pseudomonadota bacterium]